MSRLRSHFLIFGFLALVAGVLIYLDAESNLAVPQDWAQRLTTPAETGLSSGVRRVSDFVEGIRRAGRLQSENATLREQIEELRLVNVRVVELEEENLELRALLDFKEANPNYLLQVAEIVAQDTPALVVGREPSSLVQAVRINQGREAGVLPGMSVITPSGLVGRVEQSGNGWANVRLLTDERSSVTATVQQSQATGAVQGAGDRLVMRFIPHEQRVEAGDVVLTAGLGGQFPKGLVIGVVESIERNDVNPWQEAVVSSPVDFNRLEYVFVIRSFISLEETPGDGEPPAEGEAPVEGEATPAEGEAPAEGEPPAEGEAPAP